MKNHLFLKSYICSEGAVSHNVLYYLHLSVARYQVSFYANNYFEEFFFYKDCYKLSALGRKVPAIEEEHVGLRKSKCLKRFRSTESPMTPILHTSHIQLLKQIILFKNFLLCNENFQDASHRWYILWYFGW